MNPKIEEISQYAYSHKVTMYNSYESALSVINNDVKGDLVECGVAAGAQIGAFQVAIQEKKSDRKIYAYDSYEGIPLAGEFDNQQPGIGEISTDKYAPIEQRLVSSGITVHSLEGVIGNFHHWGLPIDNVVFVKGWFQHTIAESSKEIQSIALLRLDGDLHESTLICLEHLYPKVSKGGIVIIDDYALAGCKIAIEQYFESIKKPIPPMTCVDGYSVHYFVKP
jgi:O-methyltransferase/8-demethyl-8-(2,3-dimethoxy-alpha-L-rhamnosyl)tetracenomycin-C 4'-O-methyltransferase